MDVPPGTVVDSFEILQFIGRGGMGTVYEARDRNLGRSVALKFIHPDHMLSRAVVARFDKEVRVLARLHHPNVVEVFSHGISDGVHWFAQELVQGVDLAALVTHNGPLDVRRAVYVGVKIADALEYVHEAGLIHRDLKPANVMVTRQGDVRIMDFGLVLETERTRLTETGGVVGTLAYLPPEIMEGTDYTPAVDVYQLGCILYEIISGRMLCCDTELIEAGFRRLRERMRTLPDLPATVPPAVAAVLRSAVHPDPARRFQRAAALRAALTGRADDGDDESLRLELGRSTVELPVPSRTNLPAAPSANQTAPRLTALACMLLLVLATVATVVFRRPGRSPAAVDAFEARVRPTSVEVQFTTPSAEAIPWRLRRPDGTVHRAGATDGRERRHSIVVHDCVPGTTYVLTIAPAGRPAFVRDLATPMPRLAAPLSHTRSYVKPDVRFTLSGRLTHGVPLHLVVDHPLQRPLTAPTADDGTFAFSFALPAADLATSTLPFDLSAAGAPLTSGSLGLGPRTVFATRRGGSSVVDFKPDQFGDRYRRLSHHYAPFRFTVGPVLDRSGRRCFLGDCNGYVYAVDRSTGTVDWTARLPDGTEGFRPRPSAITVDERSVVAVLAADRVKARVHRLDDEACRTQWARTATPVDVDEGPEIPGLPVDVTNQIPAARLPDGDWLVSRHRMLWRVSLGRPRSDVIRWAVIVHELGDDELAMTVAAERDLVLIVGRRSSNRTADELLVAKSLATGRTLWSVPLEPTFIDLRPARPCFVANEGLVYVSTGRTVLCLALPGDGARPVERWRRPLPHQALGRPGVLPGALALFLAEQQMRLGTDMHRVSFAALDLPPDPSAPPGDLHLHETATFVLRPDLYFDDLVPFHRDYLVYFSYSNVLYGFRSPATAPWRPVTVDPLAGRVFETPTLRADGTLVFATIEGYLQTLAPHLALPRPDLLH